MRVPQRQSELNRRAGQITDRHLTRAAVEKFQAEVEKLEKLVRPKILEDLTKAREMGDLSENAAYSDAKRRLLGTDARLHELKEKIKHAIIIESGPDIAGRIRIGSQVTVRIGEREREFEITGSEETDPSAGRISHLSPIGAALLGHRVGDEVKTEINDRQVSYYILQIR